MTTRVLRLAGVASCLLGGASLVLFVMSLVLNPWDHRVSLTDDFHFGLWRGHAVFFNDSEYGPYQGSVVGLADADGNVDPPLEREIKWGYSFGGYFRYFHRTDATLWTLMLSLLWPLAIFGLPAVIWLRLWWRRGNG